jgi:tetratricopeptide (TPR) repeat protein
MDARADAVSAAQQALQQKLYPEARDAYHQLAESATLPDRRARFYLGEATAAYLGKDYTSARTAFSHALLSEDPALRANSSVGIGNTLFQLGWQSLADESYPEDLARLPDLDRFVTLVRARLANLRESAAPAPADEAGAYGPMEALITNWTDAVRHFDSALTANPSNAPARNNRNLTLIYLKRLMELLEEDQKISEELLPQPQPGEGNPEKGEGAPKDKPESREGDDQGPKPPGDKGQGNEDPKQGSDNEQAAPADKAGPKKDDKDSDKGTTDPNETPAERARKILQENADLEKGPLTSGRREFRPPEKDW